MSEFKAQILGVGLVLSIFAALNAVVPTFFGGVWDKISSQVNVVLTTNPGS